MTEPHERPAGHRVLFVTPEIAPLNKVGGLGDVGHGLVPALRRQGWDVRVLLPGYPDVLRSCRPATPVAAINDGDGRRGHLLQARAAGLDAPLYAADFPHHFAARGSPYGSWDSDTSGDAQQFLAFARAVVQIAGGAIGDWRPDVVHLNDWTTGLVPALLENVPGRPATVFTVHNLAHQGLFPRETFDELGLPASLWTMEGLEFYGRLSFMKGGLVYADRINTVSPTYALEILTETFGCGLEGLLRRRRSRLSGVLNGVDYEAWSPELDPSIPCRFDASDLAGKAHCKQDLQRHLGLAMDPHVPLAGLVTRLSYQKGIDLLIEAWSRLLDLGIQLVVLGTGDPALESALTALADARPGRSAARLAYDEPLARRIIAGADLFLMPSRFEPCGLTQMYSLRYGTVPVAARTGGLADTIVDAGTAAEDTDGPPRARATGFLFAPGDPDALVDGVVRALKYFHAAHGRSQWRRIQDAGMTADFGWAHSAHQYGDIYRQALQDAAPGPIG